MENHGIWIYQIIKLQINWPQRIQVTIMDIILMISLLLNIDKQNKIHSKLFVQTSGERNIYC